MAVQSQTGLATVFLGCGKRNAANSQRVWKKSYLRNREETRVIRLALVSAARN